ncbi:MAG TPA: hypothetical protein ENN07_00910 [candidate division Zixibacteria bacterium]|nr:hypothetical protein [candidate division Zixibacteria bacterium]
MGIDGIINKISADADEQIAKLEEQNSDAIAEIEDEADAKIAEIEADAKSRAEAERKRSFEQTLSREEAKLRVELLEVKREVVREIFGRAREKILALPKDDLRARYRELIKSFDESVGKIVVGHKDAELLDENFVESAGSFEREVSENFEHGLILIAGKIQYDARFDELFREIVEHKTDEVAQILFAEEAE